MEEVTSTCRPFRSAALMRQQAVCLAEMLALRARDAAQDELALADCIGQERAEQPVDAVAGVEPLAKRDFE